METTSSGTLQSPSTFSESSKTASSKTLSGEDRDEKDLSKDSASLPIDLECRIQAERITKILDECVYKTNLALCLPKLVQEYRTLSSIISNNHMEDLIFIFDQYDSSLFSTSLLNMEAMDDIKAGDISLKNRLNPELGHLLYIMHSYKELKPKVEEMVAEMKAEYLQEQDVDPPLGLEYLLTLEQFRQLMIAQMETTAAQELASKINSRRLEASNQKQIEHIKEYTTKLNEENKSFETTMAAKVETISKLEQELAFLDLESNMKLKKQILDSDRQMVLATRAHTVKAEMLKEEEVELRDTYETLLKNHLIEEKNQRQRRFKCETQLLSWLQKYDLEMGDKQHELDEITNMYDDEVQKIKELEIKLSKQDIDYIPLMAEREAEYYQEMTEKMNKFRMEHAARVIQCAWRDVLANRAEKKRLRKLQKKMQAAAAAAAASAAAEAAAVAAAAKKAAKAAKK